MCTWKNRWAIPSAKVAHWWKPPGSINRSCRSARSSGACEHYRKAVEIIQSGKLGEISEVKVWDYENWWPSNGSPPDCDPPPELDWDFYVGPAPVSAVQSQLLLQLRLRLVEVLRGGHQVAWGVHHFDIVLWAMGVHWPTSVCAMGGQFAFQDNREWPNTLDAVASSAPVRWPNTGSSCSTRMRIGCRREKRSHAKCFLGTNASLLLDRSRYSHRAAKSKGGSRSWPKATW